MSILFTTASRQRALAFAGALVLSLTAFTVTAGPAHAAGWSSGLTYVLMTGHGEHSMMSGSTDDYNRARAMRAGNASLLYVRQDGAAAYVIRNPAILRRAEQIMQPQQELGRRQGELGRRQGALGRQQGALGAEQGRLGRLMADARVREMHDLGQQQGELGRRQGALGAQQAALGQRQAALGREQARLAALVEPQFRALLDEAIRRGLAQRV